VGSKGQVYDLDSVSFNYIIALVADCEFTVRHTYVSSPQTYKAFCTKTSIFSVLVVANLH